MYRTQEIRWFFKKDNKTIRKWFKKHGLTFKENSCGVDIYFNSHKKNINIKLREDRIEIKQREPVPIARTRVHTAMGYCENWLKWSFTLDDPKIKNSILPDCDNNEWLEITKNRLALNIIDTDGQLDIQPLSIYSASGCQVEYTRVQVISETWYTFALEWFGEEHIDLSDNILSSILGDEKLSLKQSMSYAAFFKNKISNY